MEDALDVGLDEFADLVEIGAGTVGYVDSEISDEFREIFNDHDFIISKGMGNYEGLTEIDTSDKDLYFMFCSKCDVISRDIGVNLQDMVVDNFVDGAIIGKVESSPMIYLSGEKADQLVFLNSYLPVKIISDKIGDASRLKLLRSIYTKTVSTTLIETMEIAKEFNLEKEVLETIAYSEGDAFINSALSRIKNTKNSSSRKEEELEEIISYFKDFNDLTMTRATYKKLKRI